jgi:hypothetical protein
VLGCDGTWVSMNNIVSQRDVSDGLCKRSVLLTGEHTDEYDYEDGPGAC